MIWGPPIEPDRTWLSVIDLELCISPYVSEQISNTFGSLLRLIALMRSARRDSIWWRPMRGTTSFPSTTEVMKLLVYCTAGMLNHWHPNNKLIVRYYFNWYFDFAKNKIFHNSKLIAKCTFIYWFLNFLYKHVLKHLFVICTIIIASELLSKLTVPKLIYTISGKHIF